MRDQIEINPRIPRFHQIQPRRERVESGLRSADFDEQLLHRTTAPIAALPMRDILARRRTDVPER